MQDTILFNTPVHGGRGQVHVRDCQCSRRFDIEGDTALFSREERQF
jgi:hypothetical protein